MSIKAVIFDLDGVIVSTDEDHYHAWKQIADQEGVFFDRKTNERLRGVSRMASLNIILEKSDKAYSNEEKESLAAKKNEIYKQLLEKISPNDILEGTLSFLQEIKQRNIKTAIGSSSKNAPFILERIGLLNEFDVVISGNDISKSKPDPEVFLMAAEQLDVAAEDCLVIEDSKSGIDAAISANMVALGVGSASAYQRAHLRCKTLSDCRIETILFYRKQL